MNRKKIILFVSALTFVGLIVVLLTLGQNMHISNPYTQEYISGQGNIKGNVNVQKFSEIDPDFEIGANSSGYAVFKDPNKAFETFKELYVDGIDLIREEFGLMHMTKLNLSAYKTYGGQVSTGTPEEQVKAHFVSSFLDIYENSFDM